MLHLTVKWFRHASGNGKINSIKLSIILYFFKTFCLILRGLKQFYKVRCYKTALSATKTIEWYFQVLWKPHITSDLDVNICIWLHLLNQLNKYFWKFLPEISISGNWCIIQIFFIFLMYLSRNTRPLKSVIHFLKKNIIDICDVKSVRILKFCGSYFPAFQQNTEISLYLLEIGENTD